jgi:putative transposase
VHLSETCDLPAARQFFRSARVISKRSPLCGMSDRHSSYPGAIRLEFGPTITHRTTRYANNLLEQSYRAIKQRLRPMLGVKRFDSAVCCCHAHDEMCHFLRFQAVRQRSAPLAWQRQIRHHQFALLQEMLQAAYSFFLRFSLPTHSYAPGGNLTDPPGTTVVFPTDSNLLHHLQTAR